MYAKPSRVILYTAICLILFAGAAQASSFFKHGHFNGIEGSGDMETRELDLDRFDKIVMRGAFDLDVSFGREQKVAVTLDDNLWDNFIAEVDGSTLELDWDESCSPDGDCRIEIVVQKLEAVTIRGAGDVDVHDFEGESFTFELHGAGDLDIDGRVDDLEIDLSGAGDVDADDLQAKNVRVRLSGAGNADVYASESLDAKVSGVGNLTYAGDPAEKKTRVSGVGDISAK